jgi:hypothetical protein
VNDYKRERALALWEKTMEACDKCLALDRAMANKIADSQKIPFEHRDVDEYLDPSLWEHYVEARRDLFDFTTSGIEVITKTRQAEKAAQSQMEPGQKDSSQDVDPDIERRLISSLSEMLELEAKLTNYLEENLNVLQQTIEDLIRNQTLFTKYASQNTKPEPGYLSSQI